MFCHNENCPMMNVDTGDLPIGEETKHWNTRPIEDALQVEIRHLKDELAAAREARDEIMSALQSMSRQYLWCADATQDKPNTYSHDFMSAGEETIELLVRLGIMEHIGREQYIFIEDKPAPPEVGK
jgi:hypothetical protein